MVWLFVPAAWRHRPDDVDAQVNVTGTGGDRCPRCPPGGDTFDEVDPLAPERVVIRDADRRLRTNLGLTLSDPHHGRREGDERVAELEPYLVGLAVDREMLVPPLVLGAHAHLEGARYAVGVLEDGQQGGLVELLCVPDRGGWAEDLAQDGEVVASQHEEHHVEFGVARMVRTERFSDAGDHLGSPLLTAGGHRLGYVVDPDGQHILAPELFEVAGVVVQVDAAWAALRLDPPGRPLEGRVVHLHVTHHDQYAGLISRFL